MTSSAHQGPVGGELKGAVSVLRESAPPGRQGLYGAWQSFTVALGLLGGAGVAALPAAVLSSGELKSWGWRLPFLLTPALGLGALRLRLRLRLRLDETPAFRQGQQGARPAPRTTGKELFHGGCPRAAPAEFPVPRPADVVAPLTLLTARTVADATPAVRAFAPCPRRTPPSCVPLRPVSSDSAGRRGNRGGRADNRPPLIRFSLRPHTVAP
ncbi:hypothetical protein [Streptomyces sp. NBC_01314]|uniref:hypothetical protein n=1 Tax=Streptomyces sp. NBC_01314 TaxID=2903821 RepID=UPI00352C8484